MVEGVMSHQLSAAELVSQQILNVVPNRAWFQ